MKFYGSRGEWSAMNPMQEGGILEMSPEGGFDLEAPKVSRFLNC